MNIGTKSLLAGAHQFILHPIFVFAAWIELFGFTSDIRIWTAIFVHDLGYWGSINMDGREGKRHPLFGAWIMNVLFDRGSLLNEIHWSLKIPFRLLALLCDLVWGFEPEKMSWFNFTYFHSRTVPEDFGQQAPRPPHCSMSCDLLNHLADRRGTSRLGLADKLAIKLTPAWLYLPMVKFTGEIEEYTKNVGGKTYLEWYTDLQKSSLNWVIEVTRWNDKCPACRKVIW